MRLGEVHRDVGGGQVEKCLRQNKGHNLAPVASTSRRPTPLHHWPPVLERTKRHDGHPWTRTLPATLAGAEVCLLWPGTSLCTWSDTDTRRGYQTYVSLSRFLLLSCCCLVVVLLLSRHCLVVVSLLSVALARCSCAALALWSCAALAARYYLVTILLLSCCSLAPRCCHVALVLVSHCSLVAVSSLSFLSFIIEAY